LARWQFGITTVYHFIFVPLTIGLAPLVAVMQTAWVRTHDQKWLRLTKFFGKLFLINFAVGVVTGIVQEFQFGMNWSEYSRFVGDVFGAPLAMEALIAFFMESTFLGLWIFGWDRLSEKVHLATIWIAALGVNISAYFIIAANSFMQHPVGVVYNATTKRAELSSITKVLTNPTTLAAFPHTVSGSFLIAGTFITGLSLWWMVKHHAKRNEAEADVYRPTVRLGLLVIIISGLILVISGDASGKLMFQQQPMKMAAAEALCNSETGAGFSVFAVGPINNQCNVKTISLPGLTSYMATGDFNSPLKGVNQLQAEYTAKYGPGDYIPLLPVTYWSFRLMIGLGAGSVAIAFLGLWFTRKGQKLNEPWVGKLALWLIPAPWLALLIGWIFTEMGRQPWIVVPNPTGDASIRLTTATAVSPFVDVPSVLISLVVFTLLYGFMAVMWFGLTRRYAQEGAPVVTHENAPADDDAPLAFAY
jgi:cytochrome d ubiquinol oxidase subunit I